MTEDMFSYVPPCAQLDKDGCDRWLHTTSAMRLISPADACDFYESVIRGRMAELQQPTAQQPSAQQPTAQQPTTQQPTTQPSAQPSSAPAPAPSSSTEPSHPKNYEGKPANRPELYDASGKYDRNATLEIARAARSDKVKGVPRSCDTSFSLEGLRLKIEANSGKTEGLLMAYGALGVSSAVEILGGMEFDGVTYTCPCAKVRCNSKSLCAPKSHLAVPVPRMPKRSAGRTTDASLTSTRSPTSIWCAASS